MKKILSIDEAIRIAKELHSKKKSIVVAGGFFDILHLGHIKFLEKAKQCGDFLFVLLEDDKKAKRIKGPKRPINSQKCRAKILSSLETVDFAVLLKNMTNNKLYDKLMVEILPNVIAATDSDPYVKHKKRQAKLTGAKVTCVIKRLSHYSTTEYMKLITK